MTIDDLAPWLFRRAAGGVRWGLERTRELLAGVDNPHRRFRSVLVGGTNGKGSVAALTDAALRARGKLTTGLYTSPHLISFPERIRINGAPVREEVLLAAAERLRPEIERTDASFFEATTAIAFLCFADAGVDVATVEVGLGGRLDATNVLEPIATAVTNISRDHAEYLGESLAGIASEKAGIFRPGVPALTAETAPELVAVLRRQAGRVGADFSTLPERVQIISSRCDPDGAELEVQSHVWGDLRLRLLLPGAHQIPNALLALEILGTLPPELRPDVTALRAGFSQLRWPGRLQREQVGSTTWLLDVAHNPAGVQSLVAALPLLDLPKPVVVVAGILADKPWEEMLPPLLVHVDAAVLTTPPSAPPARRWDPDAVARALPPGPPAVRSIPEFADALGRAGTLAPHGTVLVTGSVHTVGDAMFHLGIRVG